ncbi:MAG: hypothetical protein ABIH83_00460 [Candidatus Micrarchaeota archaeon]
MEQNMHGLHPHNDTRVSPKKAVSSKIPITDNFEVLTKFTNIFKKLLKSKDDSNAIQSLKLEFKDFSYSLYELSSFSREISKYKEKKGFPKAVNAFFTVALEQCPESGDVALYLGGLQIPAITPNRSDINVYKESSDDARELFETTKKGAWFGLDIQSILKKSGWRIMPTEFLNAFKAFVTKPDDESMRIFFSYIDKMIWHGKIDSARWWLREANKHTWMRAMPQSIQTGAKILEIKKNHPFTHLPAGLSKIMLNIVVSSLVVDAKVQDYVFDKRTRGINIHGDERKALDEFANKLFCEILLRTNLVRQVYSEEGERGKPVYGPSHAPYSMTMDPIDGSKNIEPSITFGSIFSIYEDNLFGKTGRDVKASIFVLYSSPVVIIYSAGDGVYEITAKYTNGGLIKLGVSPDKLTLSGQLTKLSKYGIGGNELRWDKKLQEFKFDYLLGKLDLTHRWVGAAVADTSLILHDNGVYCYPLEKIRLLHEGIPLAYLIEQAGGKSWNFEKNNNSILDIKITDVDALCRIIMGNTLIIDEAMRRMK